MSGSLPLTGTYVAFVIASSAFFLGQIQLFPAGIAESRVLYVPVPYLPVLLPFLLMFYWLVRTLWPRHLATKALDGMDAVAHSRRFGPARKVGRRFPGSLRTSQAGERE